MTDAVASVINFVDQLLLIDTGITDATRQRVQDAAGEKFSVVKFPWCDYFSAARNFALQAAYEQDSTWALTIDTDERIDLSAFACREALLERLNARQGIAAWMVAATDDTYAKERFIRLSTVLRWVGRTHEALIGASASERDVLDEVRFWETPKTAAQYQHKLERDLVILRAETESDPDDARWWYYLGQTLDGLGDIEPAIEAYRACASREGWDEQLAWACYCAAKCLTRLTRFREAEEIAAFGMTRDAGFAELPWIAGWACYRRGALEQAVAWASIAANQGELAGRSLMRPRVGFRFLPAWYEAPYDTLRFALRQLGEEQAATLAEQRFHEAKRLRLGKQVAVRAQSRGTEI